MPSGLTNLGGDESGSSFPTMLFCLIFWKSGLPDRKHASVFWSATQKRCLVSLLPDRYSSIVSVTRNPFESTNKDDIDMSTQRLPHSELLKLKRWNTPTIYNGWEQITTHDITRDWFNVEETRDFMPQMGPMVGYAVTVAFEPSKPEHRTRNQNAWSEYRKYVASMPGPKIVVLQDLDKPDVVGSFWGEVNANNHRALGCIGTITDGAVRDVDEMCNAGFKAIARRMCVGHAFTCPVRWGCEVEVFGCKVKSGQLIHADKHGFMVIPEEDEARLLEASAFMDANECNSKIPAARDAAGKSMEEILRDMDVATKAFNDASRKFREGGILK